MMRCILLFLVVSATSFAQQVKTGRLSFTGPGVTNAVSVNSGSQPYQIANNGSNLYSSPCMPGATSTMPALRFTGGLATFKTNLRNYSFPQNVAITKLDFRLCVVRMGTTSSTIRAQLVYRRTSTGATYYAPGTPPQIAPGTYNDASPVAYGPISFLFSANGTPNINSMDADDVEIGFVGDSDPNSVFRIVGVDVRATMDRTPFQATISPVTNSYVPNGVWNNGVITLDVTLPQPSSVTGTSVKVRCGDGSFRQIETWAWGFYTPNGHSVKQYPIYFLNNGVCLTAPLMPSSTTYFAVQPLNGGTPLGNITYTTPIML